MFNKCKTSNALTISKDAKVGKEEQKPLKHVQIPQRTPWLNFVPIDMKKVSKG